MSRIPTATQSARERRHPRRIALGLVPALLAIGLALPARADAPSAPGAAEEERSPDLLVLQTGEVIGYLTPCG